MTKKISAKKLFCIIAAFGFLAYGCKTTETAAEEPVPEEESYSYSAAGTWFLGDPRSVMIYQYRDDGTGCEITINQGASFSLIYRPFNYSLTEKTISITFSDSYRPASRVFNYEMPSANRLRKFDYTPGSSPVFIKQETTQMEGIWRSVGSDNIEYLFGGRNFLLKLQQGIPISSGNFILSKETLIINDLYRCIDYYGLRWTASTASHETYLHSFNENQLTLTSGGRRLLLLKQH
ncbi:MAG: hypothetical protein FWD26_09320 [Treponema sp.]|nr:hypothetical protein [Treponema sp.]